MKEKNINLSEENNEVKKDNLNEEINIIINNIP